MNKQEAIEKLREHGAWCTECHDIHGEKDRYVKVAKVRELLEQLDEPQAEKVEVTERQAQLLEAYEGETLYALLGECNEYEQELLAKAYLFGYTVKPKRWVVKAPNEKYFVSLAYGSGIGSLAKCSAKTKDDAYPFTDKSKAEAVAVLVEGSVEEV